jgi:hypothetical protein
MANGRATEAEDHPSAGSRSGFQLAESGQKGFDARHDQAACKQTPDMITPRLDKNVALLNCATHCWTFPKRGSASPANRRHGIFMPGSTSAMEPRSGVIAPSASKSFCRRRTRIAIDNHGCAAGGRSCPR